MPDDDLDAAGVRALVADGDAGIALAIEIGDVDGVRACGKIARLPTLALGWNRAVVVHDPRAVDGDSRAVVRRGAEGVVACRVNLEGAGESGCKEVEWRAWNQGQPKLVAKNAKAVRDVDAVDVSNANRRQM